MATLFQTHFFFFFFSFFRVTYKKERRLESREGKKKKEKSGETWKLSDQRERDMLTIVTLIFFEQCHPRVARLFFFDAPHGAREGTLFSPLSPCATQVQSHSLFFCYASVWLSIAEHCWWWWWCEHNTYKSPLPHPWPVRRLFLLVRLLQCCCGHNIPTHTHTVAIRIQYTH